MARVQGSGNWGRADEARGRGWEEVGLLGLTPLLHQPRGVGERVYVPLAVVALAEDEALRREVHGSGLPNPDACLIGVLPDGRGVLQPVDFKWSLERAELRQVAGTTIERLLAMGLPRVQALLASGRAAAQLAGVELELVDGFFFAPEHVENRALLASAANARAALPLGPSDIVYWPVDPAPFFGPLEGWDLGRWLAERDRSVGLLATVEGAERYFRLGAGFAGAVVRLASPLFADAAATVDARGELTRLRGSQRLFTSADLARYLERQMASREAMQRALRDLEGTLYPFRQYRGALAARGVKLDNLDDPAKRANREQYGAIRAGVRARLREQGQALVAAGYSEPAALAELQARAPELSRIAQRIAAKIISAA